MAAHRISLGGCLLGLFLAIPTFAQTDAVLPDAEVANVEGIVKFIGVNSGCWVLETKFGRLETTNLDQAFKVDNLKVIATVRRRSDLASTCSVGRAIVTISHISLAGT